MTIGTERLRGLAREWHGNVPTHWNVQRFKHLATIRNGQVDPEDARYSALPLFAPNHIESGTGKLLGVETATEQGAESGKYLVDRGEIVYSKIRPALRKLIVAPSRGLCSADMYPIRPMRHVDARFLFYAMLGEGFSYYALLESDRVAMPKINRDALGECVFVFPELEEQRSLATFLDRKTAAIDAVIAEKQRLIGLLQEKRQAVITNAVTKGLDPSVPMKESGMDWLGSVPKHWQVAPLYSRFAVQLGKMLDSGRDDGSNHVPYLRNANVYWGRIDLDDVKTMPFSAADRLRYRLRAGDLLVCEGGANMNVVGKSAIWRGELDECYYQKALHRVRAWSADDRVEFLLYALWSAFARGVFIAGANASTVFHLTAEKLRQHRFAFPPLNEQERIVAHIGRETRRLEQLASRMEESVRTLTEYRQALITAAVTGKIDVSKEAA